MNGQTGRVSPLAAGVLPFVLLLAGCSLLVDADLDRLDRPPGLGAPCESSKECDDGRACNGIEQCAEDGSCAAGEPPSCSDDVECTNDYCDAATGVCINDPRDDRCDEGQTCMPADGCQVAISCGHDRDCDDQVECTADRCDKRGLCRFEPIDSDSDGVDQCQGDCDDSSTDIRPGLAEQCNDGADNDCNGMTDLADPACGDGCSFDDDIGEAGELEGVLDGASSMSSDLCSRSQDGPERVVRLVLGRESDVMIETLGSEIDTVIYLLDGCEGAELGCNDDRSTSNGWFDSRLWMRGLEPGVYYIVVDSARRHDGQFRLRVERSDPRGETCERPLDITGGGVVVGSTEGQDSMINQCGSDFETGPEDVFTFEISDEWEHVTLDSANTEVDLINELHEGDECNEGIRWCKDRGPTGEHSEEDLWLGRYLLVLEGYDGAEGAYTLRYSP